MTNIDLDSLPAEISSFILRPKFLINKEAKDKMELEILQNMMRWKEGSPANIFYKWLYGEFKKRYPF